MAVARASLRTALSGDPARSASGQGFIRLASLARKCQALIDWRSMYVINARRDRPDFRPFHFGSILIDMSTCFVLFAF